MLNLARVEVTSYELSRVGACEGEDGALDHGPVDSAMEGGESGAVGVVIGGRMQEVGGGGLHGTGEGLDLAGGNERVVVVGERWRARLAATGGHC